MNRISIFCPVCKRKGRRKKLLEVDRNARGIIYPFCKCCHDNIRIDLSALSAITDRK